MARPAEPAWTAQQLREVFPEDAPPRYLIRDRDLAFAGLEPTASGMASDFSDTITRLLFDRARRRLDIDVRNSEAECRTRGVQVARGMCRCVTRST